MLAMADRRECEGEPVPALRAWVGRLALTDFRCYAKAEIEADGRPVVLTGPNGAGKTNLLEALSFLAPGRGLRGARLGAVDRRPPGAEAPSGPWAVAARLASPAGVVAIGTGREAVPGEERREAVPGEERREAVPGEERRERRVLRIDGIGVKGHTALADLIAMIWLTPQMDRLLQEGASGRRRFLDRLVFTFDPAHATRVAAYEHAWRERQRLIEGLGPAADPAWLTVLEERLAESGVAIAAARRELVGRLSRAAAAGPFPQAVLAVEGVVEAWLEEAPALAAEERLRAHLAAHRSPGGPPARGPHRSDLKVVHGQNGAPAEQASTGEQKALLIAIVLAHARLIAAERGAPPVLLLDEIVAHLDGERRRHLFEALIDLGAQAWMSGTDEALFRPLGRAAQFFRIKDAAIAAGASIR